MYLTMNRFKVKPGQEAAFEAIWRSRDSHTLYASHTLWQSAADFTAWTKSEAFRAAHRGAGSHGDIYAGHPELELFASVQEITA